MSAYRMSFSEPAADASRTAHLHLYDDFNEWISDSDIMHMAQALGVKDITEIKFAENKSNGQSRGNSTQTSDDDFEELMNRNRTITSTAISKAVSDATTGDMHMAMETLLTAIAVIKQSRVYEDDCCQALVTSLKDCLVSIRGNYDSRRDRERDRVKDRERNRERERGDSHGKSRRYKERSWSAGRDRNYERDTRERDTRERDTRERDTRERDTRERDTRERDPRERDPRERDPRERDPRERDTRTGIRHRDPRDRYR
ncbi:hypothetical protein CRUP_005247 [Coryphaenoides rupestris]|nr:hypothetical protein CRUP_005247 [Coryphaenoides rupestris]